MSNFTFAEPVSSFQISVAGGLTLTSTMLTITSIIIIIANRQHDIIKYRNYETLIFFLLFFQVMAIIHTLSLAYGKPQYCETIIAMMVMSFFFISHFMLVSPSVVYHDRLNHLKLSGSNGDHGHDVSNDSKSGNRFARRFVKLPLRLVITVVIGCFYLPWFFLFNQYVDLPGDCLRNVIITNVTYRTVFIFIMGYFTYALNSVKEMFFLRLEITTITLLTAPVQILLSLCYSIRPDLFADWFDYRWLYVLMGFFTTLVNGVFPCLLLNNRFRRWLGHYVYGNMLDNEQLNKFDAKIKKFETNSDIITTIFTEPRLFESFKAFATSNWSVENLLFYQDVEKFKADCAQMKMLDGRANDIYDTYIKSGCSLEINLPFDIKKTLKNRLADHDCTADMYDSAQLHIRELMYNDTFMLWRKTAVCKEVFVAIYGASDSSLHNSTGNTSREMRSTNSSHDMVTISATAATTTTTAAAAADLV